MHKALLMLLLIAPQFPEMEKRGDAADFVVRVHKIYSMAYGSEDFPTIHTNVKPDPTAAPTPPFSQWDFDD